MMIETLFAAISALADFYQDVDWSHATDFMEFVQTTLETCFTVGRLHDNGSKKDDQDAGTS